MLNVTNAEFVTSAGRKDQFLQPDKPVIAVCGKSNVGKSSFINALANRKKLAKTSKDPGRTRLVNYFDFGVFMLADLPGYGYAQVSKAEKQRWATLLDEFFAQKEHIAHVLVLVDIRHNPTADDVQMVNFLYYHLLPFTVIATKSDKISRMQAQKSIKNIAQTFKMGEKDVLHISSQTKQGLENVLEKIESVINAEGTDD